MKNYVCQVQEFMKGMCDVVSVLIGLCSLISLEDA